ncbi:MAG: prephenate dehydrogenase/arogenate dehydrogenase family protein [Bryobacteraceae bacterium]
METVAFVGTGLMGASFGLALKKAGFDGKIAGVSSPAAIEEALDHGAIDFAAPLEEAVAAAGLVYLAQPISRIIETIAKIGPFLRPDALVTDAGSTKVRICEQALRNLPLGQFLGAHPLAGKEKRGAREADAGLFAGRPYVLTPVDAGQMETAAVREFLKWLGAIDARVAIMSAEEHDRVVAYTSHLPQLLSTTLAATLAERLAPGEVRISGPGLADALRLAGSAYEIWVDILATNPGPIETALDAAIARLQELRSNLNSSQTGRTFEIANEVSARARR